ncbi:putative sodium/hydrogen exchanger family protein [Lyophyllum shimeji]|uniref:Sodium/hydrogen exchanger family protein n=1 Tax=Lyophyllum shimeji TaxID=47721 RepID=A0A9P3UL22_LYOSH|nr:putative sodium/hydrogen exchanger family protein [Lyophyllum shimeji]
MPEFSDTVISLFHAKRAAAEQGGLLSGKDPTEVNTADPIRLWIIQLGIIVATASLLSLVLRKIRQPKVIAEVLGGIILGPTAFGRIPGFTQHIFPEDSRSYLSLTANIGLCLFLFLVGLEIDGTVIRKNARLSATVALAGMVLPFGIGAGLAVPLYHQFISESIKFTHFMLFAGVAFSITAFPVLCRILTELKLLDTTVGIVVLSAGVGNDIIGWVLLALSVALVNAGSGVTAVYILLCCVGWTLFLLFPVRYALRWLARNTGSIENGPTVVFMTVTVLILFGSAFFTDVIGVHAIFGAFVTGIIVPREGNLNITLTEKLEDMVAIIFLPLYFTLSGLSTDLGLLNDGITWAYTIAIIFAAFIGKFGGCALAAKYAAGFSWRESGAIGSLMSCKGLVELIVLNVGLSANILTRRVFSMFVLEALILTFMTTPLVTRFYPPHVRKRISATGATFGNVADDEGRQTDRKSQPGADSTKRRRFTVVLDKLEHLPGAMAISQLIQPCIPASLSPGADRSSSESSRLSPTMKSKFSPAAEASLAIEALRLIELSDRTSAVMKSSAVETLLRTDPLLAVFKMFGALNALPITPAMAVVTYDDLAYSVAEHAGSYGADMIMLPWMPPISSAEGAAEGHGDGATTPKMPTTPRATSTNPFDLLFRTGGAAHSGVEKSTAVIHSQFVRGVFAQAKTDVALFVDQSSSGTHAGAGVAGLSVGGAKGNGSQHLFLPFYGGPDDRLALEFVVQLCESERVSATVLRMMKREVEAPPLLSPAPAHAHAGDVKVLPTSPSEDANLLTVASGIPGFPDTVYGQPNTEVRMQSETADNIVWARYAAPRSDSSSSSASAAALARIEFRECATPVPLHAGIREAEGARRPGARLLIVTGRSRRLAVENHRAELKELMHEHGSVGPEVKKTIGDVATAFVVAGCGEGVVVLQAANVSSD